MVRKIAEDLLPRRGVRFGRAVAEEGSVRKTAAPGAAVRIQSM
jgi:hypothetical protein